MVNGTTIKLEDAPDVLTVEEAARYLRIGRRLAYEMVKAGELPSLRLGRRVLVPREALRAHLSRSSE